MSATLPTSQGAALIVAADRSDRRVLFDVLDQQSFEEIYSAKDIAQAREFLGPGISIDLAVVEFGGNLRDAVAFCAELQAQSGHAVPVIGIVAGRGRQWTAGDLPACVVEWLASPIRASDVQARLDIAMAQRPAVAQRPAAPPAPGDQYRFAFDGSLDELALVDPASGRILDVNDTFVRRSGYARTRLIGSRIDGFDFVLGADRRDALAQRLASESSVGVRARKPRADGGTYPVDVNIRNAMHQERVVLFYTFREIEELSRLQEAMVALLRVAQGDDRDRAEAIVRGIAEWLGLDVVVAIETGVDNVPEPKAAAAYHRFEIDEGASARYDGLLRQVLAGEEIVLGHDAWAAPAIDLSLRERRFECVLGVPVRGERQDCVGALLMARRDPMTVDMAVLAGLRLFGHALGAEFELRRAREQGRSDGLRDPLTGLPNRLLFNDRLNSAIAEAHRGSEMLAVIFVDVDRFKTINDSLGHAVGDQVLVAVARRLKATVRGTDTVARYAGDEFTLILRHIVQRDDVMRIAEKIVRAMEVPLQLADGLELSITTSLGVSFYPDDATDAERLLKQADVAMYSAKGMGRNNFQAYVAVSEESHRQRLALEAKLRQAERNGELRVFFQPQVDALSEDIVGMEALLRWEHPELGMISPGFFVPLAEETGLIISIGEWVLQAACREARRWQQEYGVRLRLGVNLSPLQLRQPTLVRTVESVLQQTGLEARMLDLEVTESISAKSIPNLITTLNGLRELGCGVSLDDFGTGQSSLDYIKRFPADSIKIDQAFVRNIGLDPDDEAIVRATLSMAHDLNCKVVAEGVETEEHFQFLRNEGCDVLQGFLFCRPLSVASFDNLLKERARLLGAGTPQPV
ncbi:MAG: EAL domain-containing protein [Dokdonella sp.]|uniref:putative bifunctional diguanylate cyclase/phosphodiesterase n=2 Tax=Dokdonella sp. TaxID=2291710 RepID=UPI0025C353CE|nr:EAL domain-containing protein [Dokdonella sp.]MBX3699992.1 EAL domain-containing protein [Dokdonella sp.]